jgi:hypothetical protein
VSHAPNFPEPRGWSYLLVVNRAGRERAGFLFLMAGKGDVLLLKRHGTGSRRSGPHLSAVYCLRASLPDLSMPGTCWATFLQSALFLAELGSVSSSDSQWAVGKDSGSADLPGGVGYRCSGYTEEAMNSDETVAAPSRWP